MVREQLLNQINSPQDVKGLKEEELPDLCIELREKLISTMSVNGGHLASNLGVVELTVALHRVFDSPRDQIVWDVSHQSYVHKLLTGRKEKFETIRKFGGLSGFTKPHESLHDPIGAGHSSTSISAAGGLAAAKTIKNEEGFSIAVIGDGALTGGLAYEGLNNAGHTKDRLIVILDDNKMSISRNVGAIARYLAKIRLQPFYFRIKDVVESILIHLPFIGKRIRKALSRSKSAIKNSLYHSTIFEELGFVYLGPVDGHNLKDVCRLLERAKKLQRPVFIHMHTVKGKGYPPAERNPKMFHGISQFDIDTGEPVKKGGIKQFSDVFGSTLCDLAATDDRICAITAAMTEGTGLAEFSKKYQNHFFDVGIAESHAAVFSVGLARNGMLPVLAIYSTFLQRAYDQLIHDIAFHNYKVVLAIDRAGLVGEDGETHQGVFDAAFLNTIPGIIVFSPTTEEELEKFLISAVYDYEGPVAVRYPRGSEPKIPADFIPTFEDYDLYGNQKADILLVTYGRLFSNVTQAVEQLKEKGLSVSVLKLNKIKPIADSCFDLASQFKKILFFEEGVEDGGIGAKFGLELMNKDYKGLYRYYGIKKGFVPQGSIDQLLAMLGLDKAGIAKTVLEECD